MTRDSSGREREGFPLFPSGILPLEEPERLQFPAGSSDSCRNEAGGRLSSHGVMERTRCSFIEGGDPIPPRLSPGTELMGSERRESWGVTWPSSMMVISTERFIGISISSFYLRHTGSRSHSFPPDRSGKEPER